MPGHTIFQEFILCMGTWSNYSVAEAVAKTDRNQRVEEEVPLAEEVLLAEEDSKRDRSVQVPWVW